jgi:lysophospholipase L1-like esterase
MRKMWVKNVVALMVGILASFLTIEILLRIYNPIPQRIKWDKIILPIKYKYKINNINNKKLDKNIVHTKNSLGFRGPEIPPNFKDYLTIIALGGSTTECFYLSDGNDWPSILERKLKDISNNVWVNNAGFDGHSTFGHKILIDDFILKIKPDIILLLVGANDVGREDLNKGYDRRISPKSYNSNKENILPKSEFYNLIRNIFRVLQAREMEVHHKEIDPLTLETLKINENEKNLILQHHKEFLDNYNKRVNLLIDSCIEANIEPILITQPLLWGDVIDPVTKVNLAELKTKKEQNGLVQWKILELYNDIIRKSAKEKNVFIIDLAKLMPKDSSYFYDDYHFTNSGAEKVAEIIFSEMKNHITNTSAGKNLH